MFQFLCWCLCRDVGGQLLARKSRLREFTLSLLVFNLRMQAMSANSQKRT
jgi:hypothetical protein